MNADGETVLPCPSVCIGGSLLKTSRGSPFGRLRALSKDEERVGRREGSPTPADRAEAVPPNGAALAMSLAFRPHAAALRARFG
jgi:hypothetical protein